MATPVRFKQCNQIAVADGCDDLPVSIVNDQDKGMTLITSCWELTPEEIEKIKETGKVWLTCFNGQPPVMVAGESPFERATGECQPIIRLDKDRQEQVDKEINNMLEGD